MIMLAWAALWTAVMPAAQAPFTHRFTLSKPAEVVATITARCARCDWGVRDREAVLLEVSIDGAYSQHIALTRGGRPAPYRILLGPLTAGRHEVTVRRDDRRSSREAGPATVERMEVRAFAADAPEYPWVSRAPILRARPGSVERFSDVPLLMYAERDVPGEAGGRYRFQYTVIFSHEDGGTPADRLMATWGRTTDIEFVYGLADDPADPNRGMIQAEDHKWIPFNGPRVGAHPVLWVSTENNMVADHGPDDVIRFAPAPVLVTLGSRSREVVMDDEPWTYAVTSAETAREGRVDPAALPRSGKLPDPRQYATIEACAEVTGATLAFDIGVRDRDGQVNWFATDRGEASFRIARGGCFRGGAPLPEGTSPKAIVSLRARVYARTSQARVVLRSVNRVFMLNASYTPALAPLVWSGELPVSAADGPVVIVR
jgi:hypothetical protein